MDGYSRPPDDRRGAPGSATIIRGLFEEAVRHHQAGRLGPAEHGYRQILALDGRNPDGLHLLGVVACQTGRHALAIDLITKAIRLRKDVADYHSNLGNALRGQGRLADAIARYRRAIALQPDHADAHNNLGNALQRQGRLDEAAQHYERALDIKPEAAGFHVNLGNVLYALNRYDEAARQYERAIGIDPNRADAHSGLGAVCEAQGRVHAAVAQYEHALAVDPALAEVRVNLGNIFQAQGRLDAAAAQYRQAIALRADIAEAHNNLGNVFRASNRLDEAVAEYERAIALKPDYADAHSNLGNARLVQGRIDAAQSAYEDAIRHAPRTGVFYRHLFSVRRAVAGDAYVAAMENLARDMQALPARDQKELHFALAKVRADLGQHERTFQHMASGNALRRRELAYDEPAALAMFARIRAVFSAELLQGMRGAGDMSAVPVFIVGMPRSGTTLVEQILASHPQVFGAGERREFEHAADALGGDDRGVVFPEIVPALSADRLRGLGHGYAAALSADAPWAARITDKMPGNFNYLGLISMALPQARIIHVQRDPIDTCLSCFMLLFETGQSYSYDLGELGRYYRGYAGLMQHWRRVLPAGAMLEVQYEDVVGNLEHEARRIVEYCGLAWDDACLGFHRSQRPVWTSSATQVRQPIYRSSVGRRLPYMPFLQPLLRELGEDGGHSGEVNAGAMGHTRHGRP